MSSRTKHGQRYQISYLPSSISARAAVKACSSAGGSPASVLAANSRGRRVDYDRLLVIGGKQSCDLSAHLLLTGASLVQESRACLRLLLQRGPVESPDLL